MDSSHSIKADAEEVESAEQPQVNTQTLAGTHFALTGDTVLNLSELRSGAASMLGVHVEPRLAGQNRSMSSEILRVHRRLRGKQYVDPRNQSMSSEILRIHHRLCGKQCVKDAIPVVSCSTFDQCLSTSKDGTSQSLWFCVGCGAAVSKDLLGISEHEKLCVKFRLCIEAQVLFLASQQQFISKTSSQQARIPEAGQYLHMARNLHVHYNQQSFGCTSTTMNTQSVALRSMDEEEVRLMLTLLEELNCLLGS